MIDRTFVDAAGVRWVVDYKTSRHEGAGLEEFLDREQQRYRPQLRALRALLRKLGARTGATRIVLSAAGAWREWPAA